MNRIWLLSGQDYRIITFNVVTTGDRQGKVAVVVVILYYKIITLIVVTMLSIPARQSLALPYNVVVIALTA